MLVDRYKQALGKSNHGGQSLYSHVLQSIEAGLRVSRLASQVPQASLDVLVLGLWLHDIGKLDPDFQEMLRAAATSQPLPPKRVKHEASTFDYDHVALAEATIHEVRSELRGTLAYELDPAHLQPEAMEWVWAMAVTHHGLFYLSYERGRDGKLRRLIRRTWTSFYPGEEGRITLADILFQFHPLGGLTIIGDLMASYAFEQGRDLRWAVDGAGSMATVFERLAAQADELENGIRQYDPRDYGLRETLKLLAGGV